MFLGKEKVRFLVARKIRTQYTYFKYNMQWKQNLIALQQLETTIQSLYISSLETNLSRKEFSSNPGISIMILSLASYTFNTKLPYFNSTVHPNNSIQSENIRNQPKKKKNAKPSYENLKQSLVTNVSCMVRSNIPFLIFYCRNLRFLTAHQHYIQNFPINK